MFLSFLVHKELLPGADLQKLGPRAKSLTGGPHLPTNTFKTEKHAVYSQNYIHFFNKGPFSVNNYDFKFQNTKCLCVLAVINSLFHIWRSSFKWGPGPLPQLPCRKSGPGCDIYVPPTTDRNCNI